MSGSAIAPAEKEKAQKILNEILRLPDNKVCADCNAMGPRWASMNLGVLVCLNCSGDALQFLITDYPFASHTEPAHVEWHMRSHGCADS